MEMKIVSIGEQKIPEQEELMLSFHSYVQILRKLRKCCLQQLLKNQLEIKTANLFTDLLKGKFLYGCLNVPMSINITSRFQDLSKGVYPLKLKLPKVGLGLTPNLMRQASRRFLKEELQMSVQKAIEKKSFKSAQAAIRNKKQELEDLSEDLLDSSELLMEMDEDELNEEAACEKNEEEASCEEDEDDNEGEDEGNDEGEDEEDEEDEGNDEEDSKVDNAEEANCADEEVSKDEEELITKEDDEVAEPLPSKKSNTKVRETDAVN